MRLSRRTLDAFKHVLYLLFPLQQLQGEPLLIDGGDKFVRIFVFGLYSVLNHRNLILLLIVNLKQLVVLELLLQIFPHLLFVGVQQTKFEIVDPSFAIEVYLLEQ